MKNLSIILNIVLFVAVAFLFYKQFEGGATKVQSINDSDGSTIAFNDVAIAYVNSDSLLTNYKLTEEIAEKLADKQGKFEKEYQNRAEGLQSEINDFQRTASNLTIAQGKALEEGLVQKQQNLRRYQESLGMQLRQEEAKLNEELFDNVSAFLKSYGEQHDLQLVLTYSRGSGVLYANEGLDISNAVIAGLNKQYEATKSDTPD
ncbi:MAG: outer membrane protein [Marivirga sp.]|jgi:outer membrane protein